MSNDLNAAGVTDPTLVFTGVTPCSSLDSNVYCIGGSLPAVTSTTISIPWSGSCVENHLQYCIAIASNPAATSCADIVVQYTNCACNTPVDVIFLFQMTAANTNQVNLVNFAQNIAPRISISTNYVNAALIHWADQGPVLYQALTGDAKVITSQMTAWKKVTQGGPNNIINAINFAVAYANTSTRVVAGTTRVVPKVIVLVSDGLPDAPCSCQNCYRTQYSSDTNTLLSNTTISGTCHAYSPTTGDFCMGCADPSILAQNINNNWKLSKHFKANWKLISYGVGSYLNYYQNKGWNMVEAMNYDPTKSILNPWNDLKTAAPQLTDAICNIY